MVLMLFGSCAEENREPRFEVWNIWDYGYCYPEGPICTPFGRCAGYLGRYQSMMWVHDQMVSHGLRSETWIYKGVKF